MSHVLPVTPLRSAWLRTAVPPIKTPKVDRDLQAHVLVIGGGICGLNAALRCAELGHDTVVVEAEEFGFGASGRSGGQLIPGLKHDPQTLIRLLGEDAGTRLARFAGTGPTETFRLIERYAIDCDAAQTGWLQPATDEANFATVRARAKAWEEFTGQVFPVIDASEVARLTGARAYVGGWIDPRGGVVQPLSYARGLAKAAQRHGVRLFSETPVEGLRYADGRWKVSIGSHTVLADRLLVCTNGYGHRLSPKFGRSFIPASSIVASTAPLPAHVRGQVLTSGLPYSDAKRLLHYVRLDRDGRFLIGARGSFALNEPDAGFKRLRQMAQHLFPALREAQWEDEWGGLFALTTDFLPHLHPVGPNAWTFVGCNGRGMSLMTVGARAMADLALTGDVSACPMPVTQMRSIPFHALRRPVLEAATIWYRTRDSLGV